MSSVVSSIEPVVSVAPVALKKVKVPRTKPVEEELEKVLLSEECKQYIKSVSKVSNKSNKAKKLSGYNVFCMESRDGMTGSPTEIMTHLGALWKSCTPVKKEVYRKKSEKLNEISLSNFVETQKDSHTEELRVLVSEAIKKYKKEVSKRRI